MFFRSKIAVVARIVAAAGVLFSLYGLEAHYGMTGDPGKEPGSEGRITGRFVDRSGDPVPGVKVYIKDRSLILLGRSDEQGFFDLSVAVNGFPKAAKISLAAMKPWYATGRVKAVVPAGETVSLGRITLAPGGAVEGCVRDSRGDPVPGICVRCGVGSVVDRDVYISTPRQQQLGRFFLPWFGASHASACQQGLTDAAGRFRLHCLPAGVVTVWAGGEGFFSSRIDPVEITAGKMKKEVDFELHAIEAANRIEGKVEMPDGVPLPSDLAVEAASEGPGETISCSERISGSGGFSFFTNCEDPFSITVSTEGGCFRPATRKNVPPGTLDLRIALSPSPSFKILVHGDDGSIPDRFAVGMVEKGFDPMLAFFEEMALPKIMIFERRDLDDSGCARIPVPEFPFRLDVTAPGFRRAVLGPFEVESIPEKLDVLLKAGLVMEGRVVARGEHVEGARVSLHGAVPPGKICRVDGFICRSMPDAVATAFTGSHGRFTFVIDDFEDFPRLRFWRDEPYGGYFIRAEADGFAPADIGPIDPDSLSGRGEMIVEIAKGGAIEGVVETGKTREPSGVIIVATRGDGFTRSTRTGPGGGYRFEGLTPGLWRVAEHDSEIDPESGFGTVFLDDDEVGEPRAEGGTICTVLEGKVARCDLDLPHETRALLAGSLSIGGLEKRGGIVELTYTEGSDGFGTPVPRIKLEKDGTFRFSDVKPTRYVMRIYLDQGEREQGDPIRKVEIGTLITLSRGKNRWDFAPPLGSLKISGAARTNEESHLRLDWVKAERPSIFETVSVSFRPDATGCCLLPAIPAGTCKIIRVGKAKPSGRPVRRKLADVEVAEGDEAVIDLGSG